jgi:hypothetical protein
MGQSLPSAHEPQRPAVQLEHVLELLDFEQVRLLSAIHYPANYEIMRAVTSEMSNFLSRATCNRSLVHEL